MGRENREWGKALYTKPGNEGKDATGGRRQFNNALASAETLTTITEERISKG